MKAIVCITDRNYLLPTKVLIASLAKHLDSDVHIFVLSQDVTKDDFSEEALGGRVTDVIDHSKTSILRELSQRSFRGRTHVTSDAMAKLQLPFMFRRYERVLYLDVDMVCCSSEINDLFDVEMFDDLVAAVPDYKIARHPFRQTLGIDERKDYFNSGLVLFHIPNCLSYLTERLVADRTVLISPVVRFVDQDTLNYLYRGRVRPLDLRFNVFANVHLGGGKTLPLEGVLKEHPNLLAFGEEELRQAMSSRVILHYTSSSKPWKTECGHEDLWWDICAELGSNLKKSDRRTTIAQVQSRSRRSLSRLKEAVQNPGKVARRVLGRAQLDEVARVLGKISKRQELLEKELQGRGATQVRFPVLLDLRWARSSEALSEELNQLFQEHSFRFGCHVLVHDSFEDRLATLAAAWDAEFHIGVGEVPHGRYFLTPMLRTRGDRLHAEYLSLLSSDSLSTSENLGCWIQLTGEPVDLTQLEEACRPELGIEFLREFSERRYDLLISRFYQAASA